MTGPSRKIYKFFKIYLPEKSSQQLKIPKAFHRYLETVCPFKAKISCPSKTSWHVHVKEAEGHIVFGNGWSTFVEDNSLHMYDFLIFSYDGYTDFHVNVFGKDATMRMESDIPLAWTEFERMTGPSRKICKFFKVYLPEKSSQQLKIPKAFNKNMKTVFPFKAKLTCRSKRSWHVNVKEVEGRIVFGKGWSTFVEDNSLLIKDFLVFSYNGNTEFHVKVFGENHCEKDVAITMETNLPLASDPEETTSEGKDQESIGSIENPCNFDSNNPPFFEIELKPTYASGAYMNIPLDFVLRYIKKDTQTATLKHGSKTWFTNLRNRAKTLVFSSGWHKFVLDNNLKVGDSCRFELTQIDDCIFNVSVLRAMDNPSKFVSKSLSFKSVMSPTYVHKGYMHISTEFSHVNMDTACGTAKLEYANKIWPVVIIKGPRRKLNFSSGWFKFVKDNNLQVGNVCIFDMIKKKNKEYNFKVSICRR